MMAFRLAIVLAAVGVILVGCESITGPQPPDRAAFRTAPIAGVDITSFPGDLGPVQVTPNLWLASPGQTCGTLVNYLLDPQILFRTSGGWYFPISHSDLVAGMQVELWIEPGTGIESICPGQIAPTHIVVSVPR